MSTQTRNPGRAAARTFAQTFAATSSVLMIAAIVLESAVQAAGARLPERWAAWLILASGVVSAVSAGLARVMAVPAVDAWLARVRLNSEPREG